MTEVAEVVTEDEAEQDDGKSPKFSTKKFALQAMLERAAAVVPSKSPVPVLSNFLVDVSEDFVRVAATDLELSIVVTGNMVQVERQGSCILPSKAVLDIVREAADGDVTIDVQDQHATIEVGDCVWRLALQDTDEYPPLPDPADIDLESVKRVDFLDAMLAVRHAASRDTRAHLMMLDVTAGRMRASNSVQLQQIKTPTLPDMSIPINAVDDLVRILKGTEVDLVGIGQDDTSLIFRVGSDEFIAAKPNAQFPDVDEMLLKPTLANDQHLTVSRSDLVAAIRRVKITADENTSAVRLTISKNAVLVSAKDTKNNSAQQSLEAQWDQKDRVATFNFQHLLQLLQSFDTTDVVLQFAVETKTRPSALYVKDVERGMEAVLTQVRGSWV